MADKVKPTLEKVRKNPRPEPRRAGMKGSSGFTTQDGETLQSMSKELRKSNLFQVRRIIQEINGDYRYVQDIFETTTADKERVHTVRNLFDNLEATLLICRESRDLRKVLEQDIENTMIKLWEFLPNKIKKKVEETLKNYQLLITFSEEIIKK